MKDEYSDIQRAFAEKAAILLNKKANLNDVELNNAAIDCVFETSNMWELMINTIFLHRLGITIDFGKYIIPRGTQLYRVRRYNAKTDYSDVKEWGPPPNASRNRLNTDGESALYLCSKPEMCILEARIESGEEYILGKYEVVNDITVGGFAAYNYIDNKGMILAEVLNAFLIAPSRQENNNELFNYLDDVFGEILPNDLMIELIDNPIRLPYIFSVMNRRENYYNITNWMSEIIKNRYPMGIRYSSCFLPAECPGIVSNSYNLVLYESGMRNLKYLECERKQHSNENFTCLNVVKTLLECQTDI